MSGLISGIGNLFGGNSAKTDRRNQLAGFGDLSNIYNFGMAQGANQLNQGNTSLQGAQQQLQGPANYYAQLLSGNRSAAMNAVAPTVNAANAQSDAQSRQLSAMGTARGGGVNAAGQQMATNKQAAIDSAITQARSGAAQGATQVAGAESNIGGTQLAAAMNLLGLGESAASNLTSLAGDSRATSYGIHQSAVASAGDLANQIVGTIFGGDDNSAVGGVLGG
jgi:hypothetical protein